MRSPVVARNLSVAAFVSGIALVAASFAVPRDTVGGDLLVYVRVGGAVLAFASAIMLTAYQLNLTRRRRMIQGDRLLARWHVGADDLRRFADAERQRTGATRNEVRFPKASTSRGIDVAVAENGVMVHDDFYMLDGMRSLQWIEGSPSCLEYTMLTQLRSGQYEWRIRVPVPDAETAKARMVWDYVYRPRAK